MTGAGSRIEDLDAGREDDEVVMIGESVTESTSRRFGAGNMRGRNCIRHIAIEEMLKAGGKRHIGVMERITELFHSVQQAMWELMVGTDF